MSHTLSTKGKIKINPIALKVMISTYTAEIYKGNASMAEYNAAMEKAAEALLAYWPHAKEHSIQVPDENSDEPRYTLKKVGWLLPYGEE